MKIIRTFLKMMMYCFKVALLYINRTLTLQEVFLFKLGALTETILSSEPFYSFSHTVFLNSFATSLTAFN